MLKYVLILCSLLFTVPALASDQKSPDVFGIELGSTVEKAERACRKHRGSWLSSHLNLFSCKAKGFHVKVEADGNDIVTNIAVSFRTAKFYVDELNSFIKNYSDLRSTKRGANNTVINEFGNKIWVAYFVSYGSNGNYSVHLYNTKDMLSK